MAAKPTKKTRNNNYTALYNFYFIFRNVQNDFFANWNFSLMKISYYGLRV